MKRFIFISLSAFAILYLALHAIVGSAPVQRKIFAEIKKGLYDFGIDLEIESIEFSAFAPRFFLNRVIIRPLPNSRIYLDEPLAIDKVKIELEPLGLLSRKIVIGETALFYPKIILPHADRFYEQLKRFLNQKKEMIVGGGGSFQLVFKRIVVQDAVFEVTSSSPAFTVRSRNIGFSLSQDISGQQAITVDSSNLELDRGQLKLRLNKVQVDFDATENSVRLNRWVLQGDEIAMDARGVAKLPLMKEGHNSTIQLNFDAKVGLNLLNAIPEIGGPKLAGAVRASGSVNVAKGAYQGSGKIEMEKIALDGYQVGTGTFQYQLDETKAKFTDFKLTAGDGDIGSTLVEVSLKPPYTLRSEMKVNGLTFKHLLASLKVENAPIFGKFDGTIAASGALQPFQMDLLVKQGLKDFYVLDKIPLGRVYDNTIVEFEEGAVEGKVSITDKGISFHSLVRALDGELNAAGTIGFDNSVKMEGQAKGLSLSRLRHIGEVPFAGKVDGTAKLSTRAGGLEISSVFEVTEGEVAEMALGKVTGTLAYRDKLLSFESLELAAIEPIRGSGFLDFRPKKNHYLFEVKSGRAGMDQVFSVLKKQSLPFPKPQGGEIGARVSIEGGHDELGVQVSGTGTARTFEWYGEQWVSGNFAFTYRPTFVDVRRVSLLKRSGALDVRGHFEGKNTFLALSTSGLRLEEVSYFGKSPLSGEVAGDIRFDGDLSFPSASGDIRLQHVLFRGAPFPDSTLKVRTNNGVSEYVLSAAANRLRARFLRSEKDGKRKSDLLLYFKDYDLAPLLTAWAKKDFPAIGSIQATGDVSLSGVFDNWKNIRGSGTITDLRMDLRDGPLRNEGAMAFSIGEGSLVVDRFRLTGRENQLSGELKYFQTGEIRGMLDGKIDLVYLQPFIPGLDFGIGRVGAALRLSGTADDFKVLGNMTLEDGTFRLEGFLDDFRGVKSQLTVTQDKLSIDRLEGSMGGGRVTAKGDLRFNQFRTLIPNISIQADRVTLKNRPYLTTQFTGDLSLKGDKMPYLISGRGQLNEARLTAFEVGEPASQSDGKPSFKFDIVAEAKDHIYVTTDVMDAEFKGRLNLVGTTQKVGLLGGVEGLRGKILFKETPFAMTNANVKFEEPNDIVPRFNVSARAVVKEEKASGAPQEYEVFLQAIGTPDKYKLRLTSVPSLGESELISLLVLGMTTRSQEGNYVDLGSVIAGQTPFQSKIQNELGVGIKVGMKQSGTVGPGGNSVPQDDAATAVGGAVPSVKIEKGIADKTKVSASTTVGSELPYKEFRIEHLLNDSFTVNATAVDRNRGTSTVESVKSYGLDFRYHFSFE